MGIWDILAGYASAGINATIGNILVVLQLAVGNLAIIVVGWFVELITSISVQSITPAAIYLIWQLIIRFLNMFFILFFVIMAYGTLFRKPQWSLQAIMPGLIAVAIILNFTYFIPSNIIGIGDQLTAAFVKPLQGSLVNEISNTMFFTGTAAAGQKDQGASDTTSDIGPTLRAFFFTITAFITMLIFLALIAFFGFRIIVAWILIITGPLVAFAAIVPSARKYLSVWFEQLASWAFFPAIYSLCMYFGMTVLIGKPTFGSSVGSLSANIGQFIYYIFGIVIFVGSLIAAKQLAGALGLATPKGFEYFEKKVGLEGITSAAAKGDIRAAFSALKTPLTNLGQATTKIPVVGRYASAIGQGATARAQRLKERAVSRIQTSKLGALTGRGGEAKAERLKALIAGAGTTASKQRDAKIIEDQQKVINDELSKASTKQERDEILKRNLSSGDPSRRTAAKIIQLEQNKGKISTAEYNALMKEVGGEKSDLGKKVADKVSIDSMYGTAADRKAALTNPDTPQSIKEKLAVKVAQNNEVQSEADYKKYLSEIKDDKAREEFKKNIDVDDIFKNKAERKAALGNPNTDKDLQKKNIDYIRDSGEINDMAILDDILNRYGNGDLLAGANSKDGKQVFTKFNFKEFFSNPTSGATNVTAIAGTPAALTALEAKYGPRQAETFIEGFRKNMEENPDTLGNREAINLKTYLNTKLAGKGDGFEKEIIKKNPYIFEPALNTYNTTTQSRLTTILLSSNNDEIKQKTKGFTDNLNTAKTVFEIGRDESYNPNQLNKLNDLKGKALDAFNLGSRIKNLGIQARQPGAVIAPIMTQIAALNGEARAKGYR